MVLCSLSGAYLWESARRGRVEGAGRGGAAGQVLRGGSTQQCGQAGDKLIVRHLTNSLPGSSILSQTHLAVRLLLWSLMHNAAELSMVWLQHSNGQQWQSPKSAVGTRAHTSTHARTHARTRIRYLREHSYLAYVTMAETDGQVHPGLAVHGFAVGVLHFRTVAGSNKDEVDSLIWEKCGRAWKGRSEIPEHQPASHGQG